MNRPTIDIRRTIWVDYRTGDGVTSTGRPVTGRISRGRKTSSLDDHLDTAATLQAQRVIIVNPPTAQDTERHKLHWLLQKTVNWKADPHRGHWLEDPPTGRFIPTAGGPGIEIRTAREWFNTDNLTPQQALMAWDALWRTLHTVTSKKASRITPSLTPARAGMQMWVQLVRNMDQDRYQLEDLDPDIAALLHRNTTQHRIEHTALTTCDCGDCAPTYAEKTIPKFAQMDGRFMFAAHCAELSLGTLTMMTATQTTDMISQNPWEGFHAEVTVTVPQNWTHLGLLGTKHTDGQGWHYPRRPGATFTTWATSRELILATKYGWDIQPHRGIHFGRKGRWLDTWVKTLTEARAAADTALPAHLDDTPVVIAAVKNALRAIVLGTIGAFHRRGRTATLVCSPNEAPSPDNFASAAEVMADGRIRVQIKQQSINTGPSYQPAVTAQIWGRARAAVLESRYSGSAAGALHMDPATILGINGDAIHATAVPTWALATTNGGLDDGKPGRLRRKGAILTGPLPTPRNHTARYKLVHEAETGNHR